jgi:hypothetical protein
MMILLSGLSFPIVTAVGDSDLIGGRLGTGEPGSCGNPTPADTESCRQIEALILRSTVRFLITTWQVAPDESGYERAYSSGHGTVKDGRFLVTHNHFNIPLSIRAADGSSELYTTITLYNAAGRQLIVAPLPDFTLVWEEPETLVLAHKDDGFFEALGFASAAFAEAGAVALEAGMEVAQVDWDEDATRVDWAKVQEVEAKDGMPRLTLDDDVLVGASGGGVFRHGVHIGNNWAQIQQLDRSGAMVAAVTWVALNTGAVVAGSTR